MKSTLLEFLSLLRIRNKMCKVTTKLFFERVTLPYLIQQDSREHIVEIFYQKTCSNFCYPSGFVLNELEYICKGIWISLKKRANFIVVSYYPESRICWSRQISNRKENQRWSLIAIWKYLRMYDSSILLKEKIFLPLLLLLIAILVSLLSICIKCIINII